MSPPLRATTWGGATHPQSSAAPGDSVKFTLREEAIRLGTERNPPNQTSRYLRHGGRRKSALHLWRSQDPQTLDSRRPGTHSARALNGTPPQGSADSLTPRADGPLHSGLGAQGLGEQPARPGSPGRRRPCLKASQQERRALSLPVAGVVGSAQLAKKRSIQLCPGVIIHCGVVNRCHEAQQLAKDMEPKFPSFAGFPIYFLVDFAS